MFDYRFNAAGIGIHIESPFPLMVDAEFSEFIGAEAPEVDIRIIPYEHALRPRTPSIGRDLLMTYYREDGYFFSESYGKFGPVVSIRYDEDFIDVRYAVNAEKYPGSIASIGKVMQLFPVRRLLMHGGALMLHASQILFEGYGILFSAPSGTGKSTQAELWKKYRSARIICNDRTILKPCEKKLAMGLHYDVEYDSICYTYGYPFDGSAPVSSNERSRLAAIVMLRQGPEDHIERLSPAHAIKALMEQAVIDVWDSEMRVWAMNTLADIVNSYPVYCLTCTPTESAVDCLSERLRKDGILYAFRQ